MTKTILSNAMTVDVEDYFQVSAFEKHISRKSWDDMECRVKANTEKILTIFNKYSVKGTFFMLGWVAEKYPDLVRTIVSNGHELASHGYQHVRIIHQDMEEFRQDVDRTKKLLEDIGGAEIKGYRAASYSINKDNLWALDILKETGHQYSSSIYPVKHDLYGIPDAPRFAFRFKNDGILEIPITTVRLINRNYPGGGGGFFRLFPYPVSRWIFKRVNNIDKQPGIFYFHPWEIDPDQPRQKGITARTRFRHYLNLERMEGRLVRLLGDFKWDRMDRIFLDSNNDKIAG